MLFWVPRLIIPMPWQHRALHEGHPGMTKMKVLSRSYYWLPSMDVNIESDNRTNFSSDEIASFMSRPQFLSTYRITPHTSVGKYVMNTM